MVIDSLLPMRLAIDEAWKYQGLTYPNPAVGAAVVDAGGRVISVAAHQKAGSAHAEVLALQYAFSSLRSDNAIMKLTDATLIHNYLISHHEDCFKQCSLYVTLEPCAHVGKTPSCAALISSLGIKKLFVGQLDPNMEAAGGAVFLQNYGIDVVTGLFEKETKDLLAPFLAWQEKPYAVFKWAQRLDGTIDGGTISTAESRRRVHAMRDISDLLVIGGNTVRKDRPVLDARLVNGKAPDVLIYSNRKDFDRNIPLFDVKNRNVFIESSLGRIGEYNNILIEGGPGLFFATREIVDHYLCFVAPKSGGTIPFTKSSEDFTFLHVMQSGKDQMLWLKADK